MRASYPCHTYIRIEACPRIEACVEDPHDAIMMCWPLWHVAQPIRTAPNALHTILCLPKVLLLLRSSLCKGCIQPGSMLGRCSDYTTPTCACGRTRHIVNTILTSTIQLRFAGSNEHQLYCTACDSILERAGDRVRSVTSRVHQGVPQEFSSRGMTELRPSGRIFHGYHVSHVCLL